MVIRVSAVMIPYNNEENSLTRLLRDLMPALWRPEIDAEVIVVDNSAERSDRLAAVVTGAGIGGRYRWQEGRNLMYGPAMNIAVELANHPYLLYVCSEHGRSLDHTWALDLLEPLIEDQTGRVAMTGTLQSAGPPTDKGFPDSLPDVHVQGGVFAARRDVLRAFPYPSGEYAQWGSDLYESFQLMHAGFRLVDVPTVRSVWRTDPGEGSWKYVHGG
jgi:hypothetical protein